MLELFVFLWVLHFDSFLTGLIYGLCGLKISKGSCAVAAVVSTAFFAAAIIFGQTLELFLPVGLLTKLAGLMLVCLTVLMVWKYCKGGYGEKISKIINEPDALDKNHDMQISVGECAMLSLALAIDALGGGMAFGILADHLEFWILLSAVMSFGFLYGANNLGKSLTKKL